ncbi:MAG: NADPH:quinone reductase [Spirochaetota bacterium]
MKAIVVEAHGGPEVLTVREVTLPEPRADEVLVEVRAIGVNPVETYQRAGAQGYEGNLPFTPGADGAGIVLAVGSGVTKVGVSDRVYLAGSVSGTYAEQCICKDSQVFPLPEGLSFDQGAALWIAYATAFRALFQRGGARQGERVLIHGGTGGVGIAAVQWTRRAGLELVATYGSEVGGKVLEAQGVSERVEHGTAEGADALRRMSEPRGFDVIVEMLANVNLQLDLELLAPRGRVIVVGSRGTIEVAPRSLMRRESDVRGVMLYGATAEELREIHTAIALAGKEGTISPIIHKSFSLENAAEAHRAVIEERSAGKIILNP